MSGSKYWTEEKVVEAFQEWNRLYGRPPKAADLFRPGQIDDGGRWPAYTTVRDVCGSWTAAMLAAGFEPRRRSKKESIVSRRPRRRPPSQWTKEEIIDLAQAWAAENGREGILGPAERNWRYDELTPEEVEKYPSGSTVKKLFGSWNNMLVEAGFRPRPVGLTARAISRYLPWMPKKSQ